MNELTAHPAANLFPMMGSSSYESLKADITERGLLEPIWLCDGKILDGRNRYRACLDLGIEPRFRQYEGDTPVSFVWSLNGERRHLTESQRGAIARKMLPELREEARKRQLSSLKKGDQTPVGIQRDERETGRATEKAAERVGVSNATVNRVEYVAKRDPELLEKIEAGEITATEAVRQIKERDGKDDQVKRASRSDRADQIRALAAEGYRGEQIAERLGIKTVSKIREIAREYGITLPEFRIGKTARIKTDRVIEETVNSLIGLRGGLEVVKDSIDRVEPEQASAWAEAISEPLKSLNWLSRKLREIANGN